MHFNLKFTLITFFLICSANASDETKLLCSEGAEQITETTSLANRLYFCIKKNNSGEKTKEGPAIGFHGPNIKSFEGTYLDGKKNGHFKFYDKAGKLKEESEILDDKYVGKGIFYWPNGKVKSKGQYENDKETGVWFFYDEVTGNVIAEGSHSEAGALFKKGEDEKQRKLQLKEEMKAKVELRKNWAEKVQSGTKVYTDKRTKITWTEFMGSANWINATLKCRKKGMMLPTSRQLQNAIENGLLNFIDNPYNVAWTSEDKTTVADVNLDAMLENFDALAVSSEGQIIPQSKREDQGIICSK